MTSNPPSPVASSPKNPGGAASLAGSPPKVVSPADTQSPKSATSAGAVAENTIEPESAELGVQGPQHVGQAHAHAQDEDEGRFSDSASTSSASVSSRVRDYVFENNRRYHRYQEGRYLIPNDEPEQEREDMKHAMVVSVCDGQLHFAPISHPQRILDIGTGTGIWAIDSKLPYLFRPSCEALNPGQGTSRQVVIT